MRGGLSEGPRGSAGVGVGFGSVIAFYNEERLYQSLDYRTPADVYGERNNVCGSVCS